MNKDHACVPYVLITPARNEAAFIETTLESVIHQTVLPLKWVIVNDGSMDATANIVSRYLAEYAWIELVNLPVRRDRNFAAKVYAFNAGFERVKNNRFEVIGNLDSDLSFEPDYLEFLLNKFQQDPHLGVAGTIFCEQGYSSATDSFEGQNHVAGGCQLFRRECFEAIGGYPTIKSGGIDLIAVLSARAKGWETRTFLDKSFIHHRGQGSALHDGLGERLHVGRKDYLIGNHPLWEIFRSAYQMTRKPYLIGGILILAAYSWNAFRRVERSIPKELMALRRREQLGRLKLVMQRRFSPRSVASIN